MARCHRCGFRAPARCRSETGAPGREIGVAQRRRCGFRAPARCRSETGAPGREIGGVRRRRCGFRAPARCRSETGAPGREIGMASVVGAGFALPRDAGRRPALQPAQLLCKCSPAREPQQSGATRRQGNADLRSAQPAEGGRREGPPVPRWSLLGRDPGVQRHPDGCVVHAISLRCAQRCRPPPGELARGRRSLPCVP